MNTIKIYTDGACRGNQNENAKGGYGAVILNGVSRLELAQGYADTTNNRMELRAIIAGLKAIEEPSKIEIMSDSKYVVDAFNKGWIRNWQKNGWKTSDRKPVKNRDLWEELLQSMESHRVIWTWVKGHSGNTENERADELACAAADSGELFDDTLPTNISHLIAPSNFNDECLCPESPTVDKSNATNNSETLRNLPEEVVKAVLKQVDLSLHKGHGDYEISTKTNSTESGGEMELSCFYPNVETLVSPCGVVLKVQWELDKTVGYIG